MEADFAVMKAVGELCAEGDFDILPILQTTLETLIDSERELEARRVLLVHDELAPTPEQCLELQSIYFSLLASPHKAVVSLGIRTIGGFCSSRKFDAREFIQHVAPMFMHASNPLQIAVLELVLDASRNHPEISEMVAPEVASALMNPNVKVQSAVLALLQSLPASSRESVSNALAPYVDQILPSLKPRFAKWVKNPPSSAEPEATLPEAPQAKFGERLEPLASADDLAFVANELLNRDLEPMRFEVFLDGLARFAAENRAMLIETFSPLQKRALNFALGKDSDGCRYPDLLIFVSRLILVFGPNPPEPGDSVIEYPPPSGNAVWPAVYEKRRFSNVMEFARSRIGELLNGIRDGRSFPLLSMPEFDLGFITPLTLLERFEFYRKSGLPPGHFDFIQAIARCHPCGFASGAVKLPESEDEASRVLRFFFSGEINGEILTPAWWLAAARTRNPFGDFSKHPPLSRFHLEHESDWCLPAIYQKPSEIKFHWGESISPLLTERYYETPPDHLYPLQHSRVGGNYGRYGSDIRWRYSFTPCFPDAVVAQDIAYTAIVGYCTESTAINAGAAVMAEIANRRLPIRYPMQAFLIMTLSGPGRPEREACIDLFIQASNDGRMESAVPALGRMFSELLHAPSRPDDPVLKLVRVVPALRQLSGQGSLLQRQLRDILVVGLEKPLQSLPKGFPSLLELLLDLVLAHPPERAIDLNAAWGGLLEGKAKSLATKISKAVAS